MVVGEEVYMNKAELDFVNEFARRLLVDWANTCIQVGQLPDSFDKPSNVYVEHAIEKGWISKTTPRKLTAKGYSTAASYLRR